MLPQLQLVENFDGYQHPCPGAEADPYGFHLLKTIETSQLQFLDTVIDVPGVLVYRFRFSPVVTQRLVPMVLLPDHGEWSS